MSRLLSALLLVFGSILGVSAVVAQELSAIRHEQRGDYYRVEFEFDELPAYRRFELTNPHRTVLDLEQARIAVPATLSAVPGSPVRALRSAIQPGGSYRFVLDLSECPNYEVRDSAQRRTSSKALTDTLAVDIVCGSFEQDTVTSRTGRSGELATPPRNSAMVEIEPERVARAQGETQPVLSTSRRDQPPAVTTTQGLQMNFSGTWQHEWAWATESSESQKFESLIHPRWDVQLSDGLDLTAIMRVRWDAVGDLGPDARKPANYSNITAPWYNSANAELSLREFYADFRAGKSSWRLGKQQIVWGQADGIKLLDVVNPQSFREWILDDFDDSRIPLWSANVTIPLNDSANLQLLWIPDTTYHELAEFGTPFAISSPRIIPALPIGAIAEPKKPNNPLSDSDAGFALSGFWAGWDLSLNYLYRYLDNPVLPARVRGPLLLALEPEYRRSHLLGGTFSTTFSNFTLRGELAYNSDIYPATRLLENDALAETAEFAGVLGLDWMIGMETLLSAQWFSSHLSDYEPEIQRDRSEHTLTLLYQQDFANSTWRFRGIGIHSVNDGDSQIQLKLSYWLGSNTQLWIGADVFSGNHDGLFGQFDSADRFLIGFEYGF